MSTLREYQRTAVAQLAEALTHLVPRLELDQFICFQAPTGSGKTVMLAQALADSTEQLTEAPFVTLWLSPGDGGLHAQSARRLRQELRSTPLTVELLDEPFLRSNPAAAPGTVLVVNWESVVTRDKKTGLYKNRLTRDGESSNLFDLLTNTADEGTRLVIVVDESHEGAGADGTEALLTAVDAVAPAVRIEASATPSRQTTSQGRSKRRHWDIVVEYEEVIAAGMIAKNIHLNLDLDRQLDSMDSEAVDGATGETLIVDAAVAQRDALAALYTAAGSPVRPLILVQLPDAKAGDAKRQSAEDLLGKHGITRGNGKLAIWLDKEKSPDLDGIADFNSPIEALLFKQAVATGWDCPRAQVLIQFRDTKSATFAIQTLGRILRMPERRHYTGPGAEPLNDAYVYSNIKEPRLAREQTAGAPVAEKTLELDLDLYGASLPQLGLRSVYRSRAGCYEAIKADVRDHVLAAADDLLTAHVPTHPPTSAREELLAGIRATVEELDAGTVDTTQARRILVSQAEVDVSIEFEKLLAEHVGAYRWVRDSVASLKSALNAWFRTRRPNWDVTDQLAVQMACLAARDAVAATLTRAVDAYKAADQERVSDLVKSNQVTNDCWELPASYRVETNSCAHIPNAPGFVYSDCFLPVAHREHTEVAFEQLLMAEAAAGRVRWWWKNGEGRQDYLGIPYDDVDGVPRTFYPDYLAMTQDGRLAVLEVKGIRDEKDATARKAVALRQWCEEMSLRGRVVTGGICAMDGTTWCVNDGTTYNHPFRGMGADPDSGWVTLRL
jgi:type III restriction enzyme